MNTDARLHILLERMGRVLQNDGFSQGLKPVQWEVLRYLEKANRFSRSHSALTSYLGTTKGTVSQTLKSLESKGLIERNIDEKDRRGLRLSLTAAGFEQLKEDPFILLQKAVEKLPVEVEQQTSDTILKLLSEIVQQQDWKPFGVCQTCKFFQQRHEQGSPSFCRLLSEPLTIGDSQAICAEHTSDLR